MRVLTLLTGRNLPTIRHGRETEPSIINEKTVADFTRVVERTGILKRDTTGHFETHNAAKLNDAGGVVLDPDSAIPR